MERNVKDFYKVAENGRTYVSAIFFNPITKEEFSSTIYDYEDIRVQISAGELYSMPINEEIRKMWLHKNGIIQIGDLVVIARGRKFKGEQKRVVKEFTYSISGMYGRSYGDIEYLVFEDGTKVAKHNCDLIQEKGRYNVYQVVFENENERVEFIVSDYEFIENTIKLKINGDYRTFNTKYFKEINIIE